jgi:hypothetical protein
MKINRNWVRSFACGAGVALLVFGSGSTQRLGAADSAAGGMVPLMLKLPAPAFKGTPKDIPLSSFVEPLSDKPRAPMMVPAGLSNLAKGNKMTCSDKNATADALAKLTDGDKEASEESIIYLRKGTQWVQVDLGSPQEIFAIALWHALKY